MMLLCDSWNHALVDKNDASLANLILNEDALLVLTTEEKIAVIERMTALPADAPQLETHPECIT